MSKSSDLIIALTVAQSTDVCTISEDRCIRLKEQARLTRELFKILNIKGCSVQVAAGANCNWVNIRYPSKQDNEWRATVRALFNDVLLRAFPNHNNRSDYQSDYFDFCWTFTPLVCDDEPVAKKNLELPF